MNLSANLSGANYSFKDIKDVLAKANEEKSGDRLAGIAAASDQERVAAKRVLSELPLEELRHHPVVDYEADEVTRIIQDAVDESVFRPIRGWTVGQLRAYILDDHTAGNDLQRLSRGLTSEMVAAVTKSMSNLDLILGARKIRVEARANTTIGLPGTLAARLQPNHPADDIEGVLASVREGLSYGCGDAVIGINPVRDDVVSVSRLLDALHDFVSRWRIPTQCCVLAHVTTQMEALRQGAPCDLVFQSLAGTESGNRAFGINAGMLFEARELALARGTASGPNVMYFETGQGSELSSNSHHLADQVTLEARCYGLARAFSPFLVNTVVGFIGPEYLADSKQVTRAALEDHFMGKLTGVPMGADICYTNHMQVDQNDLEGMAVLLGAAGVNYLMGIPMGDDVMLGYQSTSYHDIASLRLLLGLRPLPEFEAWLEEMGIMKDQRLTGQAGDPLVFTAGLDCRPERPPLTALLQTTPARIGVGRSGPRPTMESLLSFREDHAAARDAVAGEIAPGLLQRLRLPVLQSRARDRDEYILMPHLGRHLSEDSATRLQEICPDRRQVQVVISDGLSARAIDDNVEEFLPALEQGLKLNGLTTGQAVFVRFGRVGLINEIGRMLNTEVVVILIGERPGLRAPGSMSAYLAYRPTAATTEADWLVVSNIHCNGTPPAEAGAYVAHLVCQVIENQACGIALKLKTAG